MLLYELLKLYHCGMCDGLEFVMCSQGSLKPLQDQVHLNAIEHDPEACTITCTDQKLIYGMNDDFSLTCMFPIRTENKTTPNMKDISQI